MSKAIFSKKRDGKRLVNPYRQTGRRPVTTYGRRELTLSHCTTCALSLCSATCKCSDSKRPLPITGLGCARGGFPYCRAAKDHFCQDGQQLTQMHFVRYVG